MRKIPFNEKFFDQHNEKVFYWAGLLAADGCVQKKHPLVNHFIRGYFDGDGSVYIQNDTKYIEFRGTVPFLKSINRIVKSNLERKTRAAVHIHSGCGSLKYCGNKLAVQVANFMYEGATIFLHRKHYKLYT